MNWILCYLLYRKDYDSWVFLDDAVGLSKQVQSDIDYAEETAKETKDPEEAKEYREEAAIISADLEKIKAWLPTAKHRDVVSLELYEVTAFEIPLRFRDHYLDIAPDLDGWD